MTPSTMTRIAFALSAAVAWVPVVAVRAAPPTIESVAPAVGQRGTEFTLTLTGSRLAGPQELLLYTPGVVCTKLTAKGDTEVVATLRAAADCRLGEYPFRLRTADGASELRTFRVTPFPVVLEQEPNDEPRQAQAVPLDSTVAGVIEAAGTDHFAVTLKKGQRLAAEVEGIRLGADVTDTVLTVFGPDGRELVANDDNPLFRQDPFVTLVAPADGVYVVQVRETNYDGGDNCRYLLHIGTFSRPAAVFPAGGPAGTEVTVSYWGDAAGDRTQTLKLPPAGTPFELYPSDGITPAAPTPQPFRVSPFPNVIEAEPNDDPRAATANPHGWPVACNGVIDKPGDIDHFRFRASKGDVIVVEAFAFRIGSPLDPVVAVLHPDGELLASNDDDETHDSRLTVHIPADGEYRLRVADKRGQGGPRFVYRVELTRPKPGLTVFLAPPLRKTQDRTVIAVPRGNRVTAFLGVRRDGFTGPVTITPGELPPGVTLTPAVVAAGEYLVPVVFEAAPDAPLGGKLVTFTGRSDDPRSAVTGGFSQPVTLVRGPGDTVLHAVELDRLAVVVTPEAPFAVAITPPTAPLSADGTLDVTVTVTRAKDFTDPLEVSFPSLPPGVECPTAVVVPPGAGVVNVTLVASPEAEPGEWKLVAEVRVARAARGARDPLLVGMNGLGMGGPPAGGPGRRPRSRALELAPVASAITPINLVTAVIPGRFSPAAAEQGKSTRVVCEFEKPTPAPFTAKLDGLPPRVVAEPVSVPAGADRVEFTVTVDPTTPVGTVKTLVCELAGTVNGQKVVYRVGRGGVLRVDVPGGLKTDAQGQPLSPLERLRLEQKPPERP
jgi:hypothetical protein